jgi:hypothetical protein
MTSNPPTAEAGVGRQNCGCDTGRNPVFGDAATAVTRVKGRCEANAGALRIWSRSGSRAATTR